MRKLDVVDAGSIAPRVFVIQLKGEFDIAERDRLLDAFTTAEKSPFAVVSLEQATYIDSTVLECLLALKMARDKQGAELVLVGVREAVRRLFEITRLDSFFDMRSSVTDLALSESERIQHLTIESRTLT